MKSSNYFGPQRNSDSGKASHEDAAATKKKGVVVGSLRIKSNQTPKLPGNLQWNYRRAAVEVAASHNFNASD
ncbi:uncharacterized protein Dana_GF26841, isoform A [Drosophila ananassae]|uniref:Uncharacterized protein, isoform A n=1 Tax=Drosophila ananassae TaxID=7217 RepID=A0A0P8XHM9_DROAN|nr:uncharacterized protein Dana_GF26841, isoform A [Drosophila ananassae]